MGGILDYLIKTSEYPDDSIDRQAPLAVGMITRASLALRRTLDTVLRPLGLNYARYHVLSMVIRADGGELTHMQIASLLNIHIATVTGNVSALEQAGHVKRVTVDHDRRSSLVRITPEGREIYKQARTRMSEIDFGLRDISVRDLQRLSRLLDEVIIASTQTFAEISSSDS